MSQVLTLRTVALAVGCLVSIVFLTVTSIRGFETPSLHSFAGSSLHSFAGSRSAHEEVDDEVVRFNRDIRGLLADRCFPCHGPDAATLHAELRLDLRESAVDESQVIRPGDAEQSEMIRRVLSDEPSEVMPPPELNKPLSDDEKILLRRWIDQGAEYEAHWAYVAPQWPEQYPRDGSSNVATLIDEFVRQQVSTIDIEPAPSADRITLIRRLSLDLNGIPPTATEVDAFLADTTPEAYSRLVDRLLSSPRFGEQMAIYWLDLVRYADTVGYHGDQNVSQSPYRDYVIQAFNDNLPYDQFIREQLAGDLLPGASLSQLVASGYNRLNQTTEEGGSQAKEYLAIYMADRVRNVSQVFMGSTMGCAQCHDHKYDPFTAEDFYAFGAFFADLEEVGVYGNRGRPPTIHVPDAATVARLQTVDQEIQRLENRLAKTQTEARATLSDLEIAAKERFGNPVVTELNWVADDGGVVPDGKKDAAWKYITTEAGPVHSGHRSRRQESGGLVQHLFVGVDTKYTVSANSRFFAWVYLDPQNSPSAIMLQFNDGNWEHRKVWGNDDIVYGLTPESRAAYQRAGDLPATGQWVRLEVDAAEVGLSPGAKINGMAFTQHGGLAHWDDAGIFTKDTFPPLVSEGLQTPSADRSAEVAAALEAYLIEGADSVKAVSAELSKTKTQRQSIHDAAPSTVISKSVEPRTIRVLPRGNWLDDSGKIVEPAIPKFLGQLEVESRATRLDLANWLCQADNPLTARTMVNRLWSILFGRGLCSSLDDFGGQGTYPSYPELLDALAIDFVESGWDVKHTIRQIVMSEAYRRSSTGSAELQQRDPYNQWFARQQSFGLLAEAVRDSALAVSGLLVESIGGPSAHPYQPAGYYAQLNFPKREYRADLNENQYRRGVYTHWQRTFLHPMLKAFDAPSREECTAQRARSNTPLQALTLLNDPTFVEAARGLAVRILKEGGGDDIDTRIQWAYREAVSREPAAEVATELKAIYESALAEYRSNPEMIDKLLSVGISPVPEELDRVELAAWTSVARVILNLHEVITRY